MKYIIPFTLITLVVCACGRPKDAVQVSLQPNDTDTLTYVYTSGQISNMGNGKHGTIIERKLRIRIHNLFDIKTPEEINHKVFLDGLSMYQHMPGSGINRFDTDFPDSIEGKSAEMMLQNFKKLVGTHSDASYDAFGKQKNENQKALFDYVGSSEVTDFVLNHPIIFHLHDGYFWKGKKWQTTGIFKEAGVNFNTKTTFEVASINDRSLAILASSTATPAKENRPYELTTKAKLDAQYYINRKSGLVDSCHWQEYFDILADKNGTQIPVINNRTSTLRKVN